MSRPPMVLASWLLAATLALVGCGKRQFNAPPSDDSRAAEPAPQHPRVQSPAAPTPNLVGRDPHWPSPPAASQPLVAAQALASQSSLRARCERRLRAAGWRANAVTSVLDFNWDWFCELQAEADHLEDQLWRLERLGKYPEAQRFLGHTPLAVGLLAVAADPDGVAAVLDRTDRRERDVLLSVYARHPGPGQADRLTAALRRNAALVPALYRRGFDRAEALFLFERDPRTNPGGRVYEDWLRDNLAWKLRGGPEELATFLSLVVACGPGLRARLDADEQFRALFPGELWPRLLRAVGQNGEPLECFLDEPELWGLLAHHRGEELLARRGLLVVPLLFGPDAYPADLQESVCDALLNGNGDTFLALTEGLFRTDARFHELLRRRVSGPLLAGVANDLLARGPRYDDRLAEFLRLARINPGALADAVEPPPAGLVSWLPFYTHWTIARKLWQGRDVSAEEWGTAGTETAIDVASLVFPPAKAGGKAAAIGQKIFTQTTKAAAREVTGTAAQKLVARATQQQAARLALTEALTRVQANIARAGSVEVTGAVRAAFRHSRLSSAAFNRMTGLDANVFLRADGKVILHLDRLAWACAQKYLNQCWDSLKDRVREKADAWPEGPRQSSAEDDRAWEQHLAAWFLVAMSAAQHRRESPPSSARNP